MGLKIPIKNEVTGVDVMVLVAVALVAIAVVVFIVVLFSGRKKKRSEQKYDPDETA